METLRDYENRDCLNDCHSERNEESALLAYQKQILRCALNDKFESLLVKGRRVFGRKKQTAIFLANVTFRESSAAARAVNF
jgi:hypothetical protein